MANDRENFSFGDLNPFFKKKIGNVSDFQTSSPINILKQFLISSFSENITQNIDRYRGIVLRIDELHNPTSNFLKRSNFNNTKSILRSVKVRIPEIHSHLPEPLKFGNSAKESHYIIDLYPTFFAESDDVSNKPISVGDIVVVSFSDKENQIDGIYHDVLFNSDGLGAVGSKSIENKISQNSNNLGSIHNIAKKSEDPKTYLPINIVQSDKKNSLNLPNLSNISKNQELIHSSENKNMSMPKIKTDEIAFSKGKIIGKIKTVKLYDDVYVSEKIFKNLLEMIDAAKRDNIFLKINSGFRSFEQQQYLYDGYKKGLPGFNLAAKPGWSNHQNGIAIDIAGTENGQSKIYYWLAKNSYKFGFINTGRYFNSQKESWHFEWFEKNDIRLINDSKISVVEKQKSFLK